MGKIKFTYQDKTVVFPLPPTFQQLKKVVKSSFGSLLQKWSFTYLDQANDQLCVENQEDYQQFLEMNQDIDTIDANIVTEEYVEQAGPMQDDEINTRQDHEIRNREETHEQADSFLKKETNSWLKSQYQAQNAHQENDLELVLNLDAAQTELVKKQRNSDHSLSASNREIIAEVDKDKNKEKSLSANPRSILQQSKNQSVNSPNSKKQLQQGKPQPQGLSSQVDSIQNYYFALNNSQQITNSCQQPTSLRQQSHNQIPSQQLSKANQEQQQSQKSSTNNLHQQDQRTALQIEPQQMRTRFSQEQEQNHQFKRQLQEIEKQQKQERQQKDRQFVRKCVFCGGTENVDNYYNAFSLLWLCISCHKKYKIELRTSL